MSDKAERLGVRALNDPALTERMRKEWDDYCWCLKQPDILERYAGRVIATYNRVVLGTGRDDLEALEDARRQATDQQRTIPEPREILFVVVPEPVDFDVYSFSDWGPAAG